MYNIGLLALSRRTLGGGCHGGSTQLRYSISLAGTDPLWTLLSTVAVNGVDGMDVVDGDGDGDGGRGKRDEKEESESDRHINI